MRVRGLLVRVLLLVVATSIQLHSQQNEAQQKAFDYIKDLAEKGDPSAQCNLGTFYSNGNGVAKDPAKAVMWHRKAAEQGDAGGQYNLAIAYMEGKGVPLDLVEAYKWANLAVAQARPFEYVKLDGIFSIGQGQSAILNGVTFKVGESRVVKTLAGEIPIKCTGIKQNFVEIEFDGEAGPIPVPVFASTGSGNSAFDLRSELQQMLTRDQMAEAQRLSREFKPRRMPEGGSRSPGNDVANPNPQASGTGFLVSTDGFLITNEHVVRDAAQVRLVISAGLISAKVVKVDAANDLALLKAEGRFAPLPITPSRSAKLGSTVATVGFPNIGLQGFAPKLAKGEIASLSGPQDDARYFQISVPVQPGNSGGALVDERGNVVGVVSAKLSARAALAASGALPENVNYAIKSSYLLSFLESLPEVSANLKEPNTNEMKFEDVVKAAQQAAVLVLVY